MVAGSLAIRSWLDREEENRSTVLRLTCSTELAAACEELRQRDDVRLEVTVEAAGTTAARLAGVDGDAGLDGWLVSSPWPDIVDARRRSAALVPLFGSDRSVLARSPLVMVVWKDRAAVLRSRCGGDLGWRCIADATLAGGGWPALGGRPEWGPVKPGIADPVTEDAGTHVAGQAAAAFLGRSDLSTFDLEDDTFQRLFAGLARATRTIAGSPLSQMLVAGPAAYDAVGTTESEAGPLLARSARRASLDLLYPSPMATADAVIATAGAQGARVARVVGDQRSLRSLAAAGWRVAGQPAAAGIPTSPALPATNGLPAPGLLDALRERWGEVTGR